MTGAVVAPNVEWISGRPVPGDFSGPADVPFEPFEAHWLEQSPIARFEFIAERFADKVAVDDGAVQLTYAEVLRAARALARRIDAEAPPGRPIVAVFRYTALFPVALLASFAAGRPLVPIDAGYPIERQRAILANSGAATMLVQEGVPLELEAPELPRIVASFSDNAEGPWPEVTLDMEAVAGVTYTSGSTGKPKGLAWSLSGFMPTVAEYTNTHHVNPNDKIIALGSLASAGLHDALVALLNGATLRVVEVMVAGLAELLRILGEERITILSFVPTILRSVLQMDDAVPAFRHLRILDLYGDSTLANDVDFFRTRLPEDCHIRLVLGSIEAGPLFHWFVRRDFVGDALALPCGYLADRKSVAILDESGASVPLGETGELVVRSRHMALGAWQDGRLTPGPFLPDPEDPRSRIFPMGDLVTLRPDGMITFVGRRDRQVKIRGFRADLGEVEAALRQHPSVADVAVVAIREAEDNVIVAFCTARPGKPEPSTAELRALVASETAEHMSPGKVHFVETIPRLPNYKPDLVKLRTSAEAQSATAASAPQIPPAQVDPAILEGVRRAWKAVLGSRGITANTWGDAGGDSLKGLQLLFRLEETFGLELPVDLVHADATPLELAEAIATGATTEAALGETSAARPTVFLMPGLAGDSPTLAAFRRALSGHVRFIVCDYPDIEAPTEIIGDLEAIVTHVMRRVEAEASQGAIHLAGYSYGGIIAHEVARRLAAAGRTIGFVGLLDTLAAVIESEMPKPRSARLWFWELRDAARKGMLLPQAYTDIARLALRKGRPDLLHQFVRRIRGAAPNAAFGGRVALVRHLRTKALLTYVPQQFAGPVWLFRTSHFTGLGAPQDLGWSALAAEVHLIDVHGGHLEMFDPPHLPHLATVFATALGQVTEASASNSPTHPEEAST
jgi:acyl-coenzyme A synthetase/AMP-(fatty) acid ligase/thioesterase domain-containing protein/acyl carrier protein